MARHYAIPRLLPPSAPTPDYALLATGRLMPSEGDGSAPRGQQGAAPTSPCYLPRWRAANRRRRDR